MTQETSSANEAATRQFRMIYRFEERSCEITFTNNDPIAKGTDNELRKILMIWAKLCTHQRVGNSILKRRVTKALQGNKSEEKWLKARLAAFFVRHHWAEEDRSNTLVIEDLHGKRLERYVQTLPDTSDTWAVKKTGVLTFLIPPRLRAV